MNFCIADDFSNYFPRDTWCNVVVLYIYIYVLLRFIFNIFKYTIVYRRVVIRFLNYYILRYVFFFQIFTFSSCLKLLLIKCGDVETNPGPVNSDDHNLSI